MEQVLGLLVWFLLELLWLVAASREAATAERARIAQAQAPLALRDIAQPPEDSLDGSQERTE